MANFKVTVDTPEWREAMREKQRPVSEAAVAALRETSVNAVEEGRKNIAGAGRFGRNWQTGLRYRIEGEQLESKAIIFHWARLAGVFEHGAVIQGKPLLWIPTARGAPPPRRSGKKLTSATIRGQPMLFDANDRDRQRRPLYIGVPQVRIPKKWRITEIVKEHVDKFAELFRKHLKEQ